MKKILPILFFITFLYSTEDPRENRQTSLQKSAIQEWKFFDINSIYCTINSAGPYADYLRTNSSGLFWPKGSYKTAVYTSGIWIVGKHRPTGMLRTAVQQYSTEFQPGTINRTYNTDSNSISSLSEPNDKKYRIYKIKKGDGIENEDYAEWPGDLGAPYNDLNGNGKWDNGTDTPMHVGDQTLWCVYNDGNPAKHTVAGTTMPMGMEVHAMYYGFNTSGPLGNTMFIKWKIINKSDAYYDSTFVGLFSDFDLGDANDDIDGYDSTLQLAYVFNGDNDDSGPGGYGLKPPACGTLFLGGKPELQPYAVPVWIKGIDGDPPMGNSFYPIAAYNYLRGLHKITGAPNINPVTNQPDRFAFTGDPITNTGWTRLGSGFNPSDVRSLLSLGPITLAPGDTQEVNAAFVIAQGNDRLESLKNLRTDVSLIRRIFNSGLRLPISNVQRTLRNDSIVLNISLNIQSPDAKSVSIDIVSDHVPFTLKTTLLHDDGTNCDIIAHDGIFSGSVMLQSAPTPVHFNASIIDKDNSIFVWNEIAKNIPLSRLDISDPIIYSDDINHDGRVNPGENIRFGVRVNNPHTFGISELGIRSNSPHDRTAIYIKSVPPMGSAENTYDAFNAWRYLSFTLPSDYTKDVYTHTILISDSAKNFWIDSVTFFVEQHRRKTSLFHHSTGRANILFDINVVDKNGLKDHLYILRGIDSADVNYGFQLKDSTENRVLLSVLPVKPSSFDTNTVNHLIPVTDGFKIRITPSSLGMSVDYKTFYQGIFAPYSPYLSFPFWANTYRSSVHFADIPNSVVKFSKRTGYTDTNVNNVFDGFEPYRFDTTDISRSQKAYLYGNPDRFLGFIFVPFAAYDLSSTEPTKLDIVIHRRDTANLLKQWDVSLDRVYIMSTPYSSTGKKYDSTKGGLNLLPYLKGTAKFPWYFSFVNSSRYNVNQLHDTMDLQLVYTPGFSSRDAFVFNPTITTLPGVAIPTTPVLAQNYPNPFNPATVIRYSLPYRTQATIQIYNVLGQQVRTVLNDIRDAGTYEIEWNGRDENGITVSSGIYFYTLSADGITNTKKMLLIK